MSEFNNNLIDLSADDDSIIITDILNKKNPSNNIPSTPIIYPLLGPGRFIESNARNSLDNNPFDRIQKEANFQDDPFEMVFNEVDSITSNKTSSNKTNNEVIIENILQLDGSLLSSSDNNINTLKIPSFSRFGSLNSIGQLSSIDSVGSITMNNSVFGENISSISSPQNNIEFIIENTTSLVPNIDPVTIMITENGSNGKSTTISNTESCDSSHKISSDSNYSFYQNNDNSILNKKFISDNNTILIDSIEKSRLNNGFVVSENTLNLTKNIYAIPDGQSTPNHSDLKYNSSNSSIGSSSSVQLKCHKQDLRNRLLKLSISNSSINSPLASCRRNSKTSEDGNSLELSVFNEASNLAELYSQLITSSPSSNISEDSCDDLMSIKPNWIDSKSDIENDLELLKIPFLSEFDNTKCKSNNRITIDNNNSSNINITTSQNIFNKSLNDNETEQITSDLNKIKEQIQQHKIKNNSEDINKLINGLKDLIFECTQDEKKNEASNLLESLSTLLGNDINNKSEEKHQNSTENNSTKLNLLSPKPIIRQGTFDLDLKVNENIPDIDEIQDNIDPQTSQSYNYDQSEHEIEPELANIVEQIGKLIGGTQNVNIVTTNLNQNSTDINNKLLTTNPTYIVVMGTPSKRKISNNSDISPTIRTDMRRRSQSLSLHDKKLKLPNCITNPVTNPIKGSTTVRSNYIGRRNSISTTTASPVKRSIYGQTTVPKTSSINQKITPQLQQRRSINVETLSKNNPPKSINFRNDFNSKQLKFKVTCESTTMRTRGPLKATIPIKRVDPFIVTSSDDTQHVYKKPITSTPVAVTTKITNNRKSFPKACSTPTVVVSSSTTDLISPTHNSLKNRMRYSTTPNTKSNLSVQSSMIQKNRRRTFTSSKSPIKRSLEQDEFTKSLKNYKIEKPIVTQKLNIPTTLNKENKQPRFGL